MAKKKKPKQVTKKKKPKCCRREKVIGEPTVVKSVSQEAAEKALDKVFKKPVCEYYNTTTGEIYPKIFFRKDSLWTRLQRFFGFLP